MTTIVTFIIPVRHQDNAKDWKALKTNLTQTIASIAAQTDKRWRAVIVANHGADLPDLPPGFEVLPVDFPPNHNHELNELDIELFRDSFRIDKGRRVLAGMLHVPETTFFMISDDDDLVSNRIVEFAAQNSTSNGWQVDEGYVWGDGGTLMFIHNDFSHFCGTSLIIRRELYGLPERFEDATPDYIKNMLGSHVRIGKILTNQGTPLESLPFRGAVYRVGHAGAHSKSSNILKMYIFNRRNLLRPYLLLKNLSKIRFKSPAVDNTYFAVK